jgi:uncharacterized DUF497 family protein
MIYQWKPTKSFPVGAQIAAERLQSIKASAGEITPENVVEDARSNNSPLHPCFEWDDGKAAHEHRKQQARELIGALVVVEVSEKNVARETRAYVHVSSPKPRYETVAVAMSDAEMRAQFLAKGVDEIRAWRNRYADCKEFKRFILQCDKFLDEQSSG